MRLAASVGRLVYFFDPLPGVGTQATNVLGQGDLSPTCQLLSTHHVAF